MSIPVESPQASRSNDINSVEDAHLSGEGPLCRGREAASDKALFVLTEKLALE
ncbi:hypothetical protein STEG23_005545, partial [Scotinomys teguina]